MKLRTKRRLLNLASLLLVAAGAAALAAAWRFEAATGTDELAVVPSPTIAKQAAPPSSPATLDPARWNRTLRQPLYDPPPPPPQVVVEAPRPITIQVMGTAIEAKNSQAFVRQASGAVELKRVGDQVTADAADGVIAAIDPEGVLIKRADGEHRVAVKGR